jgi:UDP-glucuronate decarboxylase
MKSDVILVAGGAGFLGSHLCERLIADGNKIICLDNLQTGRIENVEHLLSHQNFQFIESDIRNEIDIYASRIYNLACPASPVAYQKDPIGTLTTSVQGSLNLLNLARRCGARILLASTSEVYGDPLVHPQHEGYLGNVNPIGPRACYDEGKRAAETLFFDFQRVHGVEIKVARIFNTYGPGMDSDDGRVVSNFVVQALAGKDITIHGDGSQTRSFCFVTDMVEGLIKLMKSQSSILGPINLGNPAEFTVSALANIVVRLTGSKSAIAFLDFPEDDPKKRQPDISVARDVLGWAPLIPLEVGILKTISYFDKNSYKVNAMGASPKVVINTMGHTSSANVVRGAGE